MKYKVQTSDEYEKFLHEHLGGNAAWTEDRVNRLSACHMWDFYSDLKKFWDQLTCEKNLGKSLSYCRALKKKWEELGLDTAAKPEEDSEFFDDWEERDD